MKPKIKETKEMKDLAQSSKGVVNYMIELCKHRKAARDWRRTKERLCRSFDFLPQSRRATWRESKREEGERVGKGSLSLNFLAV